MSKKKKRRGESERNEVSMSFDTSRPIHLSERIKLNTSFGDGDEMDPWDCIQHCLLVARYSEVREDVKRLKEHWYPEVREIAEKRVVGEN